MRFPAALARRSRMGLACRLPGLPGPAFAAPPPATVPVETASFEPAASAAGPFGFLQGISRSSYMLGDMWGLRPFLSQYGMSFAVAGNERSARQCHGRRAAKAFEYDGLTQMVLQLDTQRAFGWYGGTFNVSALQIHGRNLSADNLLTLADRERHRGGSRNAPVGALVPAEILDEDRLDIKIGQQSLDQEFMVSQNALLFVNTMFGWPMLPSADLPGGGPAYPLSALGVRVRARPIDSLTVPGGRVQRQSGAPNNTRRSAAAKPVGHQLSVERQCS